MIYFITDAEAAIITALKQALPNTQISTREPTPRPSPWVKILVGNSGQPTVPIHESLTFTVEVWHQTSEIEANKLAQAIRKEIQRWGWDRNFYLKDSNERARVVKSVAPRPASYPPGDRWVRYTATYQLILSRLAKSI